MTTVKAMTSAEQFFWKQIDKDGSGKLETIFEINNAESKGFSAKIGMTQEEFVAKNKKAIQKRAATDVDYAQYQFEQAGHQLKKADSSSSQTVEQLIEQAKSTVSQLGKKPSLGVEPETGKPVVVQQQMSQEEIKKEKEGEPAASPDRHI